jgi:hypothetical protein
MYLLELGTTYKPLVFGQKTANTGNNSALIFKLCPRAKQKTLKTTPLLREAWS